MTKLTTIGIIGEGKMGTNLFYYLLDFDFTLVWIGSAEADPEKLKKNLLKKIGRLLENGLISEEKHEFLKNNTIISSQVQDLAGCDLVIEAITENASLKRRVFKAMDPVLRVDAILASNSSSVYPQELLPSCVRKRNFVGIHFFYPVALKNIVEFITTEYTSWQTRETVEHFLQSINRKFLVLDEQHGFILNKIFLDFQNEAYLIVREGKVTTEQMDEIVKQHFFPSGVFEFIDSVGIDVMLASVMNYVRDYPQKDYFDPFVRHLQSLADAGKLGQKTQQGFYSWPKELPGEPLFIEDSSVQVLISEIIKRLSFTYISSAKRFAMQSKCDVEALNSALIEYFGTDKGPFSAGF
jgi:3-hydroxybutyryl-CoA dehydrogenase